MCVRCSPPVGGLRDVKREPRSGSIQPARLRLTARETTGLTGVSRRVQWRHVNFTGVFIYEALVCPKQRKEKKWGNGTWRRDRALIYRLLRAKQ